MIEIYTSIPEDCVVHPSGWYPISDALEITMLPLFELSTGLFWQLGAGPSAKRALELDADLASVADYEAMRKLAYHIEPYVLPSDNAALRASAKASGNDQAFRTHYMMGAAWHVIHDREQLLRIAPWPGNVPVDNVGKHWARGGLIVGWWTVHARAYGVHNDVMIQEPSAFHSSTPTYTDYASKGHLVRARRVVSSVPEQLESETDTADTEPPPMPTSPSTPPTVYRTTIRRGSKSNDVAAWQVKIGISADGEFGPQTERVTKAWQAAHSLVPDGVVGAKSWAAIGEHHISERTPTGAVDPRAPACLAALRDASAAWPLRSRASDGIMGDARHQAGTSDHNSGNAVDITHDPAHGCDASELAKLAIADERTTYVIWDRHIYNRARAAEGWRPYSGSNPHTHHVHISVRVDHRDDAGPWPWAPSG